MEPIATSVSDAAKALSVGRTSIYVLIREGRLETVKLRDAGPHYDRIYSPPRCREIDINNVADALKPAAGKAAL